MEFFTVTLEDTDTGKFHTRRMTSEMLNYLKEQGSVYGIDPVRNKILLRDGNSLVSISLIPLQKAAGIIRDTFSELHVEEELVKVTENYFKNIEERQDLFSLTERGRSVLTLSRTLNNEMKYSVTVKDEAFERINIQMERQARIASTPTHFSKEPTPVTNGNVNLGLGTTAKYTLYYGISFTPVLGNIANVSELVSMLLTQKDLLGNDANDVDFVLAGLGILLPPLKNSKKLLKIVQNLMSFIKRGGPKALGVLTKLKSQGTRVIRKTFEGAEALSSFGVNVFIDIPPSMWKNGKEIAGGALKISKGSITFKNLKSAREIAQNVYPENIGSAANRFFKKATSKSTNIKISEVGENFRFEHFSPANNPGYGKRYVKVVDKNGKTIRHVKETIDPNGNVIEVKPMEN